METKENEIFNQCRCCGANLDYRSASGGVIRCVYCGTSWTLPSFGLSAYITAQLVNGENCIDRGDFDGARACFEKVIEQAPKEPEAYFGLARAKLRVQFIVDRSGNTPCIRPICHEISTKNFMEEPAYLKAVELATDEQREVYRAQGRAIDHIREEFYRLQKNGVDYDVFLCTKVSMMGTEKSAGGAPKTADSYETKDLYYFLKEKKLKPFYSEVDAKGRTGEDYEALIYYALLKSQSMIVVCFNEEYLNTPWVKNEYTRFAEMIKRNQKAKGALTVLYLDESHRIERLPGIEGLIEGIERNKPDAYSRVEAHVKKFRAYKASQKKTEEAIANANSTKEETALLKAQNEAQRLEMKAQKEKEKQEKIRRRHELAMHKEEEKRRRKADRASGKGKGKRKRSKSSGSYRGGLASFFSSIGEGLQNGVMPLNIILAVLEIAGCLFAVIYPVVIPLAEGTVEYKIYTIVLCVLAGVLLLHALTILIGKSRKTLLIGLLLEGGVGAVCALIGWFTHNMGDWLWVEFAFGIGIGAVSFFVTANFDQAFSSAWGFALFAALCGFLFTIQTQKTSVDGFYYEVLEDGTVSVSVYQYDMEDLVIPAEIDGYRVTQVSGPFVGRDNTVENVVIPEGILKIEAEAFKGCTSLEEIRLPETVISIGDNAFEGCTALTEIELPYSVRELGESVFLGCSRLEDVNIPTAIDVIPDSCFKNCSALSEITIPDNIKTIDYNAFKGCINLKEVTLPEHSVWGLNLVLWFSEHFSADGDMSQTIQKLTEDCNYSFVRKD